MGRRMDLTFDFAAATTGVATGTPRGIGAVPTPFSVQGTFLKGAVTGRLLRMLALPKFTAAQLAGAAADVVAARDAVADVAFAVMIGANCVSGPHGAAWMADGTPQPGLGVAGADSGGDGDGVLLGDQRVSFGEGVGVVQTFEGQTAAVSVPWSVRVEIELD